ncbi:MAG: hypothetical protein ACKO7U_04345 [Actinomycetota bacterium]
MAKGNLPSFTKEQLPPRAFELAILAAAIASAVIAAIWKAAG